MITRKSNTHDFNLNKDMVRTTLPILEVRSGNRVGVARPANHG
jgi:hypothetical protein